MEPFFFLQKLGSLNATGNCFKAMTGYLNLYMVDYFYLSQTPCKVFIFVFYYKELERIVSFKINIMILATDMLSQ